MMSHNVIYLSLALVKEIGHMNFYISTSTFTKFLELLALNLVTNIWFSFYRSLECVFSF